MNNDPGSEECFFREGVSDHEFPQWRTCVLGSHYHGSCARGVLVNNAFADDKFAYETYFHSTHIEHSVFGMRGEGWNSRFQT